ncbi:MAG: hypothetical protein F4081_02790 [Dehalococcoidia bacterium]|nr:hypothetical protein [Dehalococcoidia bacterium]MYI85725.1 hypothetical protein [Dehalococcoidia bacterium]
MGTFSVAVRLSGMNGGPSMDVEATVDTGSAYTTLPGSLLRDLGVEPFDMRRFVLADGHVVETEIGETRATLGDKTVTTVVAFGEEGSPALLGAYTLEGLGLAVDPVMQRLVPARLIMY